MTRVVIDTNVFVSSFFGGNPRRVIDLWKEGHIVICLSKPVLDEYFEVLKRLGLRGEKELDELLSLFARGEGILYAARTPKVAVVSDPDDDKFLECAVALKARYVISGDKALLAVGEYMGVKVVSPKDLLGALSAR